MSVGVKGFRVGSGPHGHYIHAGTGGFYYRTALRQKHPPKPTMPGSRFEPNIAPSYAGVGPFLPVEGGDLQHMVDSDAASILKQINENRSAIGMWPIPASICVIAFGAATLATVPGNWILCLFGSVIGLIALITYRWDRARHTTVLMYDLNDDALKIFEFFVREFEMLAFTKKALNIEAEGRVHDWKRRAGAHSEVKSSPAQFGFGTPKRIETNISVPYISGGMNTVYFFPDLLIVQQRNGIGGVDYREVRVEFQNQRWIEADWIPSDAQQVGSTWRYVRRDGGPDRRFNINRQLPIMNYQCFWADRATSKKWSTCQRTRIAPVSALRSQVSRFSMVNVWSAKMPNTSRNQTRNPRGYCLRPSFS
jgi:hypothetical protein